MCCLFVSDALTVVLVSALAVASGLVIVKELPTMANEYCSYLFA